MTMLAALRCRDGWLVAADSACSDSSMQMRVAGKTRRYACGSVVASCGDIVALPSTDYSLSDIGEDIIRLTADGNVSLLVADATTLDVALVEHGVVLQCLDGVVAAGSGAAVALGALATAVDKAADCAMADAEGYMRKTLLAAVRYAPGCDGPIHVHQVPAADGGDADA